MDNNNKNENIKTFNAPTIIGLILIVIGLGILLYPVVVRLIDEIVQSREEKYVTKNWEKTKYINQAQINIAKEYNEKLAYLELRNSVTGNNPATLSSVTYNDVFRSYNPFSFLKIPSINIKNLAIRKGVGDDSLMNGLGHLPGTSFPVGGINTHAVVTGHSGLVDRTYFSDLEKVKIGDKFYFNTVGKKLAYKVIRILVVDPSEVKYIRIYKGKDLATLITCVPLGINTHRLLVTGKRVPYEEDGGENWSLLSLLVSILTLGLGIVFALIFRFSRFKNFYYKYLMLAVFIIAIIILPLFFIIDNIFSTMLLINDFTIIFILLFAVFVILNFVNEIRIRHLLNLFAESDIIYYRVYNERLRDVNRSVG